MSTPEKYRVTVEFPFTEPSDKTDSFFDNLAELTVNTFGEANFDAWGLPHPNQAHMDWCKGWLKNYLRLTGKVDEVDLMEMVNKIYEELCL